jgi:hypothetical protein
MTDYFHDYNVAIDPEQAWQLPDGTWHQEVTLVLVDWGSGSTRRGPVAVTLDPDQARELAFELLCAAEHAQRTMTPTEQENEQ